jgi:hypothetical protein
MGYSHGARYSVASCTQFCVREGSLTAMTNDLETLGGGRRITRIAGRTIKALALATAVTLLASLVTVLAPANVESASAADARLFNPGNIVSDAVFFDGDAMSSASVQDFLNSQVAQCGNNNCLKNYSQATPSMPAIAGRCAAYAGQASETAAQIIARVGEACDISQKVMLVLLQKEQGLVTRASPSAAVLNKATGYACPDTAACDAAFSGFFFQIYHAARQFKSYAANPTGYNYRAGRVNTIQYHPNAACGSSAVYIENVATAGLYNYTPYQPNASALANLYGSGDSCGAYGNRNFFRMFTDWFGSPTVGTSLIRTADSPNVYLISGSNKYLIPTASLLSSYSILGGVATVSPSVMAVYNTQQNASRIIRSASGGIFFHDASIKLGAANCELVADYGGSCGAAGYTQLTDYQVSLFANGPALSNLYGTTAGGRYVIDDGIKREVLDSQSATNAGISGVYPILTEAAIAGFSYGAPFVRDSVFIQSRDNGRYFLYTAGSLHSVAGAAESQYGVTQRSSGSLTTSSLVQLNATQPAFTGVVTSGGATSVLTPTSRVSWAATLPNVSAGALPVSAALLNTYPAQTVADGSFVKFVSLSAVYRVSGTTLRPVPSWETLVALGAGTAPAIVVLPDVVMNRFAMGLALLEPGTLVKTAGSAAVYLIDGASSRIPLPSFAISSAMAIEGYATIPDNQMATYGVASSVLGYVVQCGTTQYLAAGGSLHAMNATLVGQFRLPSVALSPATCSTVPVGAAAQQFIRVPSGSIYQVVNGQKKPIASMARFLQLDPTGAAFTNVDAGLAALLPTGSAA